MGARARPGALVSGPAPAQPALQVGLFLLDFSRQQETSPSAHITPGVFLGWRKMSLEASVCPISDTSGGAELTQSLAVELHGLCREPRALYHVGGLVATSPLHSALRKISALIYQSATKQL